MVAKGLQGTRFGEEEVGQCNCPPPTFYTIEGLGSGGVQGRWDKTHCLLQCNMRRHVCSHVAVC